MKYIDFLKKIILFILIIFNVCSYHEQEDFLTTLIDKSQKFNQSYPYERVNIQTDRTYYKPGDELWFKAIIANTLENSQLSNDLFIELYDQSGNEIDIIRYPVGDNEVNSYFILSENLDPGKYQLYAYTSWMKNLNNKIVFKKDILVGNKISRTVHFKLNFNKTYYLSGDNVNVNIKLTLPGGSPLSSSNYSYNVNSLSKKIIAGTLKTNNDGQSDLNFTLPKDLNEDFLSFELKVKYNKIDEIYVDEIPLVKKEINFKLFPEGGTLMGGINTRVAFSSTDKYGRPIDIKGYIADTLNRRITEISSANKGLGMFSFTPETGMKYKAVLTSPVFTELTYNLPEIKSEGILLTYRGIVNNEILFSVRYANPAGVINSSCIGEANNKIIYAAKIQFANSKVVKIPITGEYKHGIVKFTVFINGKAEAERNIYIPSVNKDDSVFFAALQDVNDKRKKAELKITGLQEKDGQISFIKVTNSENLSENEISVSDYFTFAAAFKDFNSDYSTNENIYDIADLLCMTQTLYSLPYNDIVNKITNEFLPFYTRDGILGRVTDKKGNPIANAMVKATNFTDMAKFENSTNTDGYFNLKFKNNIIKMNDLNFHLVEKTDYSIEIIDEYSDYNKSRNKVNQEDWSTSIYLNLFKYHNPDLIYTGKQDKLNQKKYVAEVSKGYDYETFSNFTSVLDIIRVIKPYSLMNNQIVFTGTVNSFENQSGALIVIDGIKSGTNADILNSLPPKDVKNLIVSTNPIDISRHTGLNSVGVIEIETTTKDKAEANTSGQIKDSDKVPGISMDHKFSSPDYSTLQNTEPDERVTLLWDTNVEFQPGTNLLKEFYTSDVSGIYQCELMLKDKTGEFRSKKVMIEVK